VFLTGILNSILVLIAIIWWWPYKFFKWFTKENIKRFIKDNITESPDSNLKIAASVGLGLFFGVSPLWGYQMITAVAAAHLLRLNKVLTLVSSNISIPPMIPFLLYGSYVTGCKVLGDPVNLHLNELSFENVKSVIEQYLIGSVIFAVGCSILAGTIAFILLTACRKKKI
jgi:uncharacterized protein (DUF2062 family)